jgi:hypothetical protein
MTKDIAFNRIENTTSNTEDATIVDIETNHQLNSNASDDYSNNSNINLTVTISSQHSKHCSFCNRDNHTRNECVMNCFKCGGKGHNGLVCGTKYCRNCKNSTHNTEKCGIRKCSWCHSEDHTYGKCPNINKPKSSKIYDNIWPKLK